jgi:hypothetical protein
MRSRIARTSVVVAVLAVAGLLGAGCNSPTSPDAATVNGHTISQGHLFDAADVYASLPGDPYQLRQGVDSKGAYSGSGMANLLTSQVVDKIFLDAAKRYGLAPDVQIEQQIDQQMSSTQAGASQITLLNGLTGADRQAFLEAQALRQQVIDYVGKNPWWTDEEAAHYGQLGDEGQLTATGCLHHILVTTESEAQQIVDQIHAGANFEDLAKSKSTDTGSAPSGGDLGCNQKGAFIPAFEDAVVGAQTGDLIGPVQTDAGYHVIRVDQAYVPTPIEEAGSNGWIDFVLHASDISVDPRFGSWDVQSFAVVPPKGAAPPTNARPSL